MVSPGIAIFVVCVRGEFMSGECMKCEKCRTSEATIHLTEIIKNIKSEYHLCEKCARLVGINSGVSSFSLSVPDMLSFLDLEEVGDVVDNNMCLNCGLSFLEYKRSGKLGCPQCYGYLKEPLGPVLRGHHGGDRHTGKVPSNCVEVNSCRRVYLEDRSPAVESGKDLADLRKMLESAIGDERYEDAAVLRDRIRDLEAVAKE